MMSMVPRPLQGIVKGPRTYWSWCAKSVSYVARSRQPTSGTDRVARHVLEKVRRAAEHRV